MAMDERLIADRAQKDRSTAALIAFLTIAVTVQPILGSSTVSRNFDAPKSMLLAVASFVSIGIALFFGIRTIPRAPAPARRLLGLGIVVFLVSLFISTIAAPSFWTAFLGTLQRRQGFITEITEFSVFPVAAYLTFVGSITPRDLVKWVVIGGAGVAASAVCQSHRVGKLDPTPWEAELFNRVAGSMGAPSLLETYLAVVVPLTAGAFLCAFRSRAARECTVIGLVLILEIIASIYARGRTGFAGMAAGMVFLLLTLRPSGVIERWFSRLIAFFIFSAVLFVGLLNLPGKPLDALTRGDSAFAHLCHRLATISDFGKNTGRIRIILGEAAGQALSARPVSLAIGFGPDGAWDAIAPFDTEERKEIDRAYTPQDRPHQIGAERLLINGIPGMGAWWFLLILGAVSAVTAAGHAAAGRRLLGMTCLVSVGGFVLAWVLNGSLAFAGAAVMLSAAAVFLIFACGVFYNQFRRESVIEALHDEPVFVAIAAALIAHMVAGSFGVSMAPERSLVWAIAGCGCGALARSQQRAGKPLDNKLSAGATAGPSGTWLAGEPDGLFLGSAMLSNLPQYAFFAFGWFAIPGVFYAGAIVPLTILAVGLMLQKILRPAAIIESLIIFGAGLLLLYLCARLTEGTWIAAMQHYFLMSVYLPATILIILVANFVGRLSGPAVFPASAGGGVLARSRIAGALVFICGIFYSYISFCELGADTAFLAFKRLNAVAVSIDDEARHTDDVKLKDTRRTDATFVHEMAQEALAGARNWGAPLHFLGSPAVIDRQLPSERPR